MTSTSLALGGGFGIAGLALLTKGLSVSGAALAGSGFIIGGETIQGIISTKNNSSLPGIEKIIDIGITIIVGTLTTAAVTYAIPALSPTLSISRGLLVTGLGMVVTPLSNSNSIPYSIRCILGSAGRSSFTSGILLTAFSGFKTFSA